MRWSVGMSGLTALVLIVGCAAPGGPSFSDRAAPLASPKRITAVIMSEPQILSWRLSQGDNLRAGLDTVEPLILVGLTDLDNQGRRRALLAEQVPTVDNGWWRLFPDGRMELTWRIKDHARWHDGAAVSAEDLVFTTTVVQDRELPQFGDARYRFIEAVSAPDPRTVVVAWKQPFVEADALFTSELALPLPSHILRTAYQEEKASLLTQPYWSDAFVGTGPFRVQEFVRGSHILLQANPDYVLGRPRIDTIEVKLILDDKTLVANVLAGAVELTLGRTMSVEQALDVRERWREGRIEVAPVNFLRLHPQFLDPSPPISGHVQFRRALLHAIDRQEMVDTLMYGLSAVAHSFLDPGQAAYQDIEQRLVVRYEYDPRRADQLLAELGIAKDAAGLYQLPVGQGGGPLVVDLLVSASQDINVKSMYAVANFSRFYSSQAPVAENNYVGNNGPRYMNPEFDALLDRYYVTIPLSERINLIGQIIHTISSELIVLPLFYGAEPVAIGHRLLNVGTRASTATQAWNAHEWEVR